MSHRLWYTKPASHWEEGLPLGNGRLGAMEMGGGAFARIALNEETLWSGYPKDTNRQGAAAHYVEVRDLALAGRFHEAQTLIETEMLGGFTQSYLPLGDLLLSHTGAHDERYHFRELSLSHALHTTDYSLDGVRFQRRTFVSHPAQALFVKITADRPAAISLSVCLTSKLRHSLAAAGSQILLDALAPSDVVPSYIDCEDPVRYFEEPHRRGMRCRAVLQAFAAGGRITADGQQLQILGADSAELRLAARTSFNGFSHHPYLDGLDEKALCEEDQARLRSLSWEQAFDRHQSDHRMFFDRMGFTLGGDRYEGMPTDERLTHPLADDLALFPLLFDFGRYLLIASSRPGGEPANLQGIWNQDLRAIWSCNETLNINLEMNYWAAQSAALPEMCEPLFSLIEGLCETGKETARVHYGARGATAHHNTDIWRLSNPVGEQHKGFAGCAFWPLSLGWLCRHLTEHWQYTDDPVFLARRALPVIRQAARFYLDTAVTGPDGYLTIAPATSPENVLLYEGKPCKVAGRAAMTTEIIRELLQSYLQALDALQQSEPMAGEARAALLRLAPFGIGSRGQALEWEREYAEEEPHHRHVSQLYRLYPGHSVLRDTPEAVACARTLRLRGDDGTGWSLAWKAALWARLGDGDHALRLVRRQLQPVDAGTDCNLNHGGSYLSLLCAHPPFQIDGNFGACAAMIEMLMRIDGDCITLLPALPSQWEQGEVTGLRAPHGTRLSFRFAQGRVQHAVVEKKAGAEIRLTINGETFTLAPGSPAVFEYPGRL